MKFNDLDFFNSNLNNKILTNLTKTIKENKFIFSKEVIKLEKKLKKLSNSRYAITTGSGTDSLILSLMAIKRKKNKNEIIIPAFSWLSVAEAVLLLGYKPIYADVETMTFNISVKDVQKKINKKTLAIISTSLFGRSCDLIKLREIVTTRIIGSLLIRRDKRLDVGGCSTYPKNISKRVSQWTHIVQTH